ncbi:MAG: DUF1996 domain-containing protein [Cyanobacteria bacterium P01_F01_bin.116]
MRQQMGAYLEVLKLTMSRFHTNNKILLKLSLFFLIIAQAPTPGIAQGTIEIDDKNTNAIVASTHSSASTASLDGNNHSGRIVIAQNSHAGHNKNNGGNVDHSKMVMAHNGPNFQTLTNKYAKRSDQRVGDKPLKTRNARKIKKGLFKMFCKLSHFNYDDPLVFDAASNPRKNGTHLHMFWGNPKANYAMTRRVQMASPSSSCNGGTKNLSAYWIPAVLDKNNNPQIPDQIHNYYKDGNIRGGKKDPKQRPEDFSKLSKIMHNPMPDGLRMLIGNATATSPQNNKHILLECSNSKNGSKEVTVPSFKEAAKKCTQGGRLQITMFFPQCWNGKDLDSRDHISHMAYPKKRKCPSSHPYPLPRLSYQIRFFNLTKAELASMPTWHLSSDGYNWAQKGGGFSLHADFVEGWKPEAKKDFVLNCLRVTRFCDN